MHRESQDHLVTSSDPFVLRALLLGAAVCVLSVLTGIAMMFWREYSTELFQMPRRVAYDLTIQATLGPLFMGAVLLFPLTAIVAFLLAIAFIIGFRTRRLWLVTVCFIVIGLYWLWLVKLISDGAFD